MSTEPNVDRLTRLRDILQAVDPKHFNLDWWATSDCGTACCAVGFAGLDPGFRAEGFHLIVAKLRFGRVKDMPFPATRLADFKAPLFGKADGRPAYDGSTGYRAVSRFFGLSLHQTYRLFSPTHYSPAERRDPSVVIRRIDAMIAACRKEPRLEPEVAASIGEGRHQSARA